MRPVVTWGAPHGETINIAPEQERRLTAAGLWPRTDRGEEYCKVTHGLHYGTPAADEDLGL